MTAAKERSFVISAKDVRFRRAEDGTVLMRAGEEETPIATLVGAFPLTHPQGMIALRDLQGEEIGILDCVEGLDEESRKIVREGLERSYFMPRITDILDIQESLNVVEWEVQTNKGPRSFEVRNVRKNIRRFGSRRLVIRDVDANRYEIRDWMQLPPYAQKLLEPYM